ncbi:MAG: radical SAM protein, partial [Bacteroidota bacterium]
MAQKEKNIHPSQVPFMVYADEKGNLFEDTKFEAVGRSAHTIQRLQASDFVLLPEGSSLFHLPLRKATGFNIQKKEISNRPKGLACAAFVAPAYSQTHMAAWETLPDAPILPLYAYSVLGWLDDQFYTTAFRVDPDIRQDCDQFDQRIVEKNANKLVKEYPDNRLIHHLYHCACVYLCPAARNFFLKRWEAPLPTSPSCNSNCKGCISWQPKSSGITSPQNRIAFAPTAEEIAEVALMHIAVAPNPVVSFGQGCEGEPLLVWETLRDAIKLIRKKTKKGTINLNTNGSMPAAVQAMIDVGLDSIRISLNSAQKELYNSYYRPKKYSFEDIIKSAQVAKRNKK